MWLSKYSASGNDFLISHSLKRSNRAKLAKKLCNRFDGIGADGFVVLLPHAKYAYEWEFYNADGSHANMCGNAARCVAHYALLNDFAPKKHSFLSGAGEIKVSVEKFDKREGLVEVDFGKVKSLKRGIKEFGLTWELLDSGVPHLISFVKKDIFKQRDINMLASLRKKYNANVNLALLKNDCEIELCTFERGVENITQACGTGIASVFYSAQKSKLVKSRAIVIPPHGDKVECELKEKRIAIRGEAKKIADIVI